MMKLDRHIGLGRDLGDQLLDLAHTFVLGPLKDILVILLSELSGELMKAAEVELPTRDHAKNAGKIVGRTACPDALGRNCFRHVKPPRTERKHRGERGA